MTSNLVSLVREHRWIVILSMVYVLLGAMRLNDLSLYTDSTRYVIWGTSFAHAKGFVDETQPEPERYVVNAPLFSVLLLPALLIFPNSLIAAKICTLLWGVAFIVMFYRLLLRFFGKMAATLAVLPIVFNPLVLILSTEALSETAFLTFISVCFLSLEHLEPEHQTDNHSIITLLAVTSLIVLLREVAITLVGSVLLFFLARKQYKRAILVLVGFAVFFGAWLYRNLVLVGAPADSQATNINFIFQHFVTPTQSPLAQEFGARFMNNLSGYGVHLLGMLFYPLPEMLIVEPTGIFLAYFKTTIILKYVIPFLFVPLLLLGVWRDTTERKTGSARFMFVVFYLAIILLYPVQDIRFLLPAFLIFIFYVVGGTRWIGERWFRNQVVGGNALTLGLVALVVLPNLICIFELERTNLRYMSDPVGFYNHEQQAGRGRNIFMNPWRVLGQSIRDHTPEGSIIAGALKEASIFIGDRKLMELNNAVPMPTFDWYLRRFAADYVISTRSWDNFPSYEFQMGESRRFWFEPISQVAGMRLFKVHSTLVSPREVWFATKRMEIDSTSANGLLRMGRWQLMGGRFNEAIASLRRAKELAPGQAMIPYQLCVTYSMCGRLSEASEELRKLYDYAQSSSYTPIASRHLQVGYALRQAETSDNPMQRSMTIVDISSFYWNLGYFGAAYSTLRGLLDQDSTYFTGLLWGWDYAMQRGDTSHAKDYLRQVSRIDRTNPVVRQFLAIEQTEDSLRRASDPLLRSTLHLAIARSYKAVDLPDEAIDEAQRALRENPRNADAWLFQAQLFEESKASLAARSAYQHVLELDPANATARLKISAK